MKLSPIYYPVFIKDNKTGEEYKLGILMEIEGASEGLKVKIKLYGLSNNYIRMHGGKPMRTIPRRFCK